MKLFEKYITIMFAPPDEGAAAAAANTMSADDNMTNIAESLLGGGEPVKPARVARAAVTDPVDDEDDTPDDQVDAVDDPDVDPADVDLLENGDDDTPDAGEDDDDSRYTDPDEVEHEVLVDGQPTKAKLKELKADYSGRKAIEQRLQQAGELRKQSELFATQLMTQLNGEATRLQRLDQILQEAENPNINWEQLRVTDPQRYLIEKDKQQEIQNKRQTVANTFTQNQEKQRTLALHRQNDYAKQEADVLMTKLPDLRNPDKARALSATWDKAATQYGFQPEEVAGIIDHRMLLVLNDAAKYRALVNAKNARQAKGQTGTRQSTPKPLLRPGNQNTGQRSLTSRAEKEAITRANQSGAVDDVAATLLVNSPRRNGLKKTGF